jgi:hypothetical protein
MQYKVLNFPPSKDPQADLQRTINSEASTGWKYVCHQYNQYSTSGSEGCFGFGAKPGSIIHVGMIVFEKS